jgi:hypothetical protein
MENPDASSAEWIAEAPSACDGSGSCQPLPLSDFGTVQFTSATATADGHTGTISDPNWSAQAIQLGSGGASDVSYGGQGSAGASPTSLSSDGSSFSVAYASQAAGAAGGQGNNGYGNGGYGDGGYPGGYGGYDGGYPGGYGDYGYGGGYDYGYGGGYGYGAF